MAMPLHKVEESQQVHVSPSYDKLFDGDLNMADNNQYRRQMTVCDCERLLNSGALEVKS